VQLLDVLARTGRSLSELAGVMSRLPQVLRNVRIGALGSAPDELDARLAPDLDTAREELGSNGRVLVRRSGTEPLVRVMVEAETAERAEAVAEQLAAAVVRHTSSHAAQRFSADS
jgi:phosphoglucosamine mutase